MPDEKDDGRIIHVPTEPGKHDLHYEGSGRFAPKDGVGKETYDEESKEYVDKADEDSFDLSSLDTVKLDDDLFDLEDLTDVKLDEDLESLVVEDDLVDVEKEMAKIPTLKNYRATRERRIKAEKPIFSMELAKLWQEKMRDIIDRSLPISRIPTEYFYDLIVSGKFMNQFESKHGEGAETYYSSDGGYRGEMSHVCFGTENRGSTEEQRYKWEKYGTLCPDDDLASIFEDKDGAASQYGRIACVYKNNVRPFTTYTMEDSLAFSDQHPILLNDVPDEYCMHRRDRMGIPMDELRACKNINDVKDVLGTSYYEAQIHVPELSIKNYISAIAVPYSQINGSYFSSKYKENFRVADVMKIAKEKYPNLDFFSRDRVGRIRKIFINDAGEIEWERKDFALNLD